MTVQFSLRRVTPGDEPFLFELFAAEQGGQFSLLNLPAAALESLLRMQFAAQRADYRRRYPYSEEDLIIAGDKRVGYVWRNEWQECVRIIDISIAPGYRNRGLGTAVIRSVLEYAATFGKPVHLSMARANTQAFALYQRLGFRIRAEDAIYLELECTRDSPASWCAIKNNLV